MSKKDISEILAILKNNNSGKFNTKLEDFIKENPEFILHL